MSQVDRSMLRRFHCPYRGEGTTCYHENTPERCMFAHPTTGLSPVATLPSYVCFFALLGKCKAKNIPRKYCNHGIHLTLHELNNLAQYEADHIELISEFYGGDENRECVICFERVLDKPIFTQRRFGLLENCSHCFCSTCLTEWREHSTKCPICQIDSARMEANRSFLLDGPQKARLFQRATSRPSPILSTPPVLTSGFIQIRFN